MGTPRRRFWDKQFHVLSVDMFKVTVGVAVNMDEKEIERAVRRVAKPKYVDIDQWVEAELKGWDESRSTGGRMTQFGGGFVVFLRFEKNCERDAIGIVVHEMVHVAQYLLRDRRIPLQEDTEEVHAYLTEHLVVEALKMVL